MDADKKARIGRTMGFILIGLALINTTLFIVKMAVGRTPSTALLATALGAFTIGAIMVRGKGKSA